MENTAFSKGYDHHCLIFIIPLPTVLNRKLVMDCREIAGFFFSLAASIAALKQLLTPGDVAFS